MKRQSGKQFRRLGGLLGGVVAAAVLLMQGALPASAAEEEGTILYDGEAERLLPEEVEIGGGQKLSAGHNSFANAQRIYVNNPVLDNLSASSSSNWYSFETSRDGYVSVTFSHDLVNSSGVYWRVYLLDSQQTQIAYWSYQGNTKGEGTSYKFGLGSGTYYIRVESYNFSGANYRLTVNHGESDQWEREFNDTLLSANTLPVNSERNGNLRNSYDKDFYQFELDQDGYVAVAFSHDILDASAAFWRVCLLDSEGGQIADWKYNGNTPGVTRSSNYGLGKGTYYLEVEGDSYTDANYAVKVDFATSQYWEKELNDTIVTADAFPVNTEMNGNLRNSTDLDWYRITTTEGGYFSLTFTHEYVDSANAYWRIYLLDGDGNPVEYWEYKGNTKSAETTPKYHFEAGTHYLRVEASSYSDVNYRLSSTYTTVQTMYRLYNPNSSEHFYTADESERDHLSSIGWNYEGIAWTAPASSDTPVYRLYNPNAGDHHYTPNAAERDHLISLGWKDEGIGWYSDEAGTTPLYRLYNPNAAKAGAHHYTANAEERDRLVAFGWKDEGIGWYGK